MPCLHGCAVSQDQALRCEASYRPAEIQGSVQ